MGSWLCPSCHADLFEHECGSAEIDAGIPLAPLPHRELISPEDSFFKLCSIADLSSYRTKQLSSMQKDHWYVCVVQALPCCSKCPQAIRGTLAMQHPCIYRSWPYVPGASDCLAMTLAHVVPDSWTRPMSIFVLVILQRSLCWV